MATDKKIQSIIHKLEEGGWAKWLQLATVLAALAGLFYLLLFSNGGFRGLVHPHAFAQAEVGRELARGHGFSTKIFIPAALAQMRRNERPLPIGAIPDTYHAPLWSATLAPFLWLARDTWKMNKLEFSYPSDRVVVSLSTIFFFLSVLVSFFLARRLFDDRLAVIAAGLLLVCDHLWQFSLSGLPQMMMLFLFTCAMYCLLRAVERREEERLAVESDEPVVEEKAVETSELTPPPEPPAESPRQSGEVVRTRRKSPLPWLIGAAFLFAALLLTHALTLWIFLGAVLFCLFYFRPLGLYAGLMLAIVAICYTPWLVRNYQVSGNPFGLAISSSLVGLRGAESTIMRTMEKQDRVSPGYFRPKLFAQADTQLSNIYGLLGSVIAAPFFFIALLHLFRRRSTAIFRWCILLCWLGAFFGMCLFGMDEAGLQANDLHVLFLPLATCYGLAFILVLWSRLEIRIRLVRVAFMAMLFILSGHTFMINVLESIRSNTSRVQWPPYLPPWIAIVGSFAKEDELIMSDMPWALAWYGDRKSLWVPSTIKEYFALNDWDQLHGHIMGLYLTPISGNAAFLAEIRKGDWAEWGAFIDRTAVLTNFPLKKATVIPIEPWCIFYADRDRWTVRED